MADTFSTFDPGLNGPYENVALVTPNDSTDLTNVTRGLLVGTKGDLKLTFVGGTTALVPDLAAGVIHRLRVQRVWASGASAVDVVAFW